MATRGRPPKPGGATSAADRKREFDRRLRNADGQIPGEPARTPVVLYLSAEARAALKRNRAAAVALGAEPLLDSKLVETLLLEHPVASHIEPSAPVERKPWPTSGQTAPEQEARVDRLLKMQDENRRLKEELREARRTNRCLIQAIESESMSKEHWSAALEDLVDHHQVAGSRLLRPLVTRLTAQLAEARSESTRLRIVSEELVDYLYKLVAELPGK